MTDVAKLRGVGPVLQSQLANAGITTIEDVALAEPVVLLTVPGIGRRRGSMLIVQARAALGDELDRLIAGARESHVEPQRPPEKRVGGAGPKKKGKKGNKRKKKGKKKKGKKRR